MTLTDILASRPRWISMDERHPPRNAMVAYMIQPTTEDMDPYPAVADEWRDEHHLEGAVAWLEM
jgi:hypothetical protein